MMSDDKYNILTGATPAEAVVHEAEEAAKREEEAKLKQDQEDAEAYAADKVRKKMQEEKELTGNDDTFISPKDLDFLNDK